MTAEKLIAQLEGVKETPTGWKAKCPAHDDKKPSLCVDIANDGKVLIKCHAGCSSEDVLRAARLEWSDLYSDEEKKRGRGTSRGAKNEKPGSTKTKAVTAAATATIDATYEYRDAAGEILYRVVRLKPKDFRVQHRVSSDTKAGWVWGQGGKPKVIYRLPEVVAAVTANKTIFIVEGEKDVHSLEKLGLVATCNQGGAGKWLKSFAQYLNGADVVILPDNDSAGRTHAEAVAKTLQDKAARTRVLKLPGLPPKGDVTDWVNSGGTADALASLVDAAADWEPAPEPEVDSTVGLDGELLNDLGNARRLAKMHGDSIRFCCGTGKWYIWDNTRWAEDITNEILRIAAAVVDSMRAAAKAAKKEAEAEADDVKLAAANLFESHTRAAGDRSKLNSMVELAASLAGVATVADDYDKDDYLFNCANGTIDLRTGELRAHDRADLITKQSPVTYKPDAPCPAWTRFLEEIFQADKELIRFVQAAAGYTMTGDTREQVFFILHGIGSNGKTTFISTLCDIFGDYETKTSTETFLEKNSGNSNGVAALQGARFVNAVEISAGRRLNEGLVKEVSGSDKVSARYLYQEYFTFTPKLKLWLACNHAPTIQGQDHGMWRRIKLIPFNVQFRDPEDGIEPYKDKHLPDKLSAEREGILAWLVRGCLDWQKKGLPVTAAVKAATSKLQQNMDVLGGFFAERCVFDRQASVTAKDLYVAYSRWAEANGEKPLSQRWFGLRLSERGTCERIKVGSRWSWHGIGLIDNDLPGGPTNIGGSTSEDAPHVPHVPHNSKSPYVRAGSQKIHDDTHDTHDSSRKCKELKHGVHGVHGVDSQKIYACDGRPGQDCPGEVTIHLDKIAQHGIRVSIGQDDALCFDPAWLATPAIVDLAREHKEEIIHEIRSGAAAAPNYNILMVAPDLTMWEEDDPRGGYELGEYPTYRMLDADYYVWLRSRMENAQKYYKAGRLESCDYEAMRQKFNTIHDWAMEHIGAVNLQAAKNTLDVAAYIPPSAETLAAYHAEWGELYDKWVAAGQPEARLADSCGTEQVVELSLFDD